MKSLARLAAVATASAALVLGSAAAASAQSTTIDDKRYDVLNGATGKRASQGPYAEAIASRNVDVDKVRINHGKDFVAIDVDFHRLSASGDAGVQAAIDVPGGNTVNYVLSVVPEGTSGRIFAATQSVDNNSGLSCYSDTDSRRIKGTSKTGLDGFVTVYVPRACFGNPAKVRVQSVSLYIHEGNSDVRSGRQAAKVAAESSSFLFVDPVSAKYYMTPQITGWLKRN